MLRFCRPLIFLVCKASQKDISYMILNINCMYIYLILCYIRIYPCLYLLGKNKAHSLYRCVGSCISLILNRSNSSCCISGNKTLLVISVSFSICSGNMSLANMVCIASWVVFLIFSTFKSLVAQNLLFGHQWWSLYSLSFLIKQFNNIINTTLYLLDLPMLGYSFV